MAKWEIKGLKQLVTHFVFCSLVYNSWAITTTIICRPWLLVCLTSSYFGGYQSAHQLPKILPPTLPVTNLGLTRLCCIIDLINLFLGSLDFGSTVYASVPGTIIRGDQKSTRWDWWSISWRLAALSFLSNLSTFLSICLCLCWISFKKLWIFLGEERI